MNCILLLIVVLAPPCCFLQSTLSTLIGFDQKVVVLSPGCQGSDLFSARRLGHWLVIRPKTVASSANFMMVMKLCGAHTPEENQR